MADGNAVNPSDDNNCHTRSDAYEWGPVNHDSSSPRTIFHIYVIVKGTRQEHRRSLCAVGRPRALKTPCRRLDTKTGKYHVLYYANEIMWNALRCCPLPVVRRHARKSQSQTANLPRYRLDALDSRLVSRSPVSPNLRFDCLVIAHAADRSFLV